MAWGAIAAAATPFILNALSPQTKQVQAPSSEKVDQTTDFRNRKVTGLENQEQLGPLIEMLKNFQGGGIGNDSSGFVQDLLNQNANDQNPAGYEADRDNLIQDYNDALNQNVHRSLSNGRQGDSQLRAFNTGSENLAAGLTESYDRNLNQSRQQQGQFAQLLGNLKNLEANSPLTQANLYADALRPFNQVSDETSLEELLKNSKGNKTNTYAGKSKGEVASGLLSSFLGREKSGSDGPTPYAQKSNVTPAASRANSRGRGYR